MCWQLPYAHVLPLILPHRFSLIILTDLSDIYISWRYIIVAYWGPKKSRFCNYLFSLNIATTALFPYVLILFYHISEASVVCCLVVIVSPYLSFVFLDLEKLLASIRPMQFPHIVGSRRSIPLPTDSILGLPVYVSSNY